MDGWRKAMVCGLGASGAAAARLLRAEGVAVLAVDERDTLELRRSTAALAEVSALVDPEHPFDPAWCAAVAVFLAGNTEDA